VLAIDDFGVGAELINTVFEGSGLFGNCADLVAGRFKKADPAWLYDNYFHGRMGDDWVEQATELLALRDATGFPLKPLTRGTMGGVVRRAWDRKRALGRFDRSLTGTIALIIGTPVRFVLLALRRVSRRVTRPPRT